MTRNTIKLAIEALRAMRQKIAPDANIAKMGSTYPAAQKALEKYNAITEAIKELEEQP